MKLAVITDEISQEFEHALDVMSEYGARGAELRGLWGTNIADLDAEQVKRAKRALAERGMTVPALSTPVFKCELVSKETAAQGPLHLAKERSLAEQPELLRRCAGLAHAFGTDLIRVFAFWKREPLTPEAEARIVEAFGDLVKVAEAEGVTLLLENEHACLIGTGAEAARVISAVNSPRLRACWDPGNAFMAGEQPYPAGYEALRPHVAHVHVKDAVAANGAEPARWVVVGEGDIDFRSQLAALRRDGYSGWISLETHYVPAGGTTEEGSRACLGALRDLLMAVE
jgi:sugar phosphate isomerase/epimerase